VPELLTLESQHPSDDLDHAVRFSNWLPTDDTISSCAVSVSSGITLGSSTKAPLIAGSNIVFWLSGGEPGREYYVQVTAQTTQGRRKIVDGAILILDPTPL
jgi:hypothetical protein